jgi:hypothetical protein
MIDELRPPLIRDFVHPALLLAGLVFVVALALLPFAFGRDDSGGPAGLLTAAGISLATGWIGEGVACALAHRVAPLVAMLAGMAIRVVPPMAVCIAILASGQSGRAHLALISYLLVFYFATLALETHFAVKRAGRSASKPSHHARPSA